MVQACLTRSLLYCVMGWGMPGAMTRALPAMQEEGALIRKERQSLSIVFPERKGRAGNSG